MGRLLEELRRRRVFRVAAVYAVVSWVAIQIADTLFPALQLPNWTITFITVILILGFFPTMVAAWAYERTPEGIKPDAQVQSSPGTQATSAQPVNYVILAIVLMVAGFQLADRFVATDDQAALSSVQDRPDDNPVSQFSVILDEELIFRTTTGDTQGLAISPDASQIIFTGFYTQTEEFVRQLVRRPLSQRELIPIPGTESAYNPFFSPDGESVAFFTDDGLLKRVTFDGRPPVTLTDSANVFSKGAWADANIYFLVNGRLMSVSVEGGPAIEVPTAHPELAGELDRILSMPSKSELLLGREQPASDEIFLFNLASGEAISLLDNARLVGYIDEGYLVFVRDGTLMASRFDFESRRIGSAVPVLQSFLWDNSRRNPQVAISNSGTLVFATENPFTRPATLTRVLADGTRSIIAEFNKPAVGATLSPDGRLAAITSGGFPFSVYLWDMQLQVPTGFEIDGARNPSWHPDGEHVIFSRATDIVSVNIEDGSEEVLLSSQGYLENASFAPDGETLVFAARDEEGIRNIYALLPNEESPRIIISAEQDSVSPVISPNGQWLAYVQRTETQWVVYVARFPSGTNRQRISTNDFGFYPQWRDDEMALFFMAGSNPTVQIDMRMAELQSEASLNFGSPQSLFTAYAQGDAQYPFHFLNLSGIIDMSAAGDEFWLVYHDFIQDSRELVVTQNWATELERLLPDDRY